MVYEEPKKMLLYGDACRVSTDPIAKASYFFDLIQISYADTDPIYTIENYPNFFRVVPSENALSLARIPFIRHFNWTRVGTIYQNLPRYSLPHSKLLTDLERYNVVIKQSVSLPGSVDGLQNRDLGDELRKLKDKDVRIILGNFDEEWALLLFCEAFRERMIGRKYQWILTGVSEDKLWKYYKSKGSSCSEQELLIAMDGYIITDITPVSRSQHRTISGMMAHEYSSEYRRRAQEMNIVIEENKFYGYVYDGIWAIALALHRVDYQLKYYHRLAESGQGKLNPEIEDLHSLLDFDYHKPIWVKLIRNALNRTRFNGVTGTVSFHKNERPGLISFSQFQAFRDMNEVIIGCYDALIDHLDLKVGFPIFWRGHSPPIDYTIQRVTPFRINRTIFVIISILSVFGIALACIFLTINIKFRNQRYIKMSSPYLNNLIIIGCILTYLSVIILGLDSGLTSEYNFPYICNARAWVLMAGFTLAFGSMFSKTFRVHSIFTNIKLHKKVIKDYKLFMVVFILLTFDVCILVIWQYFDPFYRETNNGTSIQDADNEDIIIVPEMEHCQSKRMTIFLSVIYVYKGLLMAFGCFLAWETRHVSIPALNDSKYIGLSVYNVVIMCVIGASLSFVLRDQQDASFMIISIFIIFCSTTTLCLVFVPKLIELKQNPRAGDHRVRATLKTFKKNYHEGNIGSPAECRDIHGNIIHRGFGVDLNERIKILLGENIKQRLVLKEKTYELEALTYKYRKIQNMVQTGQYTKAVNTITCGSLGVAQLPCGPGPCNSPNSCKTLTSRPPAHESVKFSIRRDENQIIPEFEEPLVGQVLECKSDLRKSPLMSSTTQITTTNTTSSTNNHTETTTDCSISKVLSSVTSTSDGYNSLANESGKRALVTYECSLSDVKTTSGKQPALEDRVAGNLKAVDCSKNFKNAAKSEKLSVLFMDDPRRSDSNAGNSDKPSPKYTTDSSYCSMGAEYELSGSRRSQEDLGLFTIFSYKARNEANWKRKRGLERGQSPECRFNRWLDGPFCTLMVKKDGPKSATRHLGAIEDFSTSRAPGRAMREVTLGDNRSRLVHSALASCPNITSHVNDSRLISEGDICIQTRPVRRSQIARARMTGPLEFRAQSKGNLTTNRLPRTLSMIEYLGLNEIDLIARRHDKVMHCNVVSAERSNCCKCCPQGRASVRVSKCQFKSESDIPFSSSDPLNSTDLMPTSSRLSCSTCCSLASPLDASESDLFGEATGSSQTDSSHTITTSDSLSNQGHYSSNSQSSQSSSIVVGRQQPTARCVHHAHQARGQRYHHHHEYHQSDGATSTSSQSSMMNRDKSMNNEEHSLCISGSLHCAPSSKEDANDSAQLFGKTDLGTGNEQACNSQTSNVTECKAAIVQETQDEYLIKCDVVENL